MDWSCKYRWFVGELELGGFFVVRDMYYLNCFYFYLIIKIYC